MSFCSQISDQKYQISDDFGGTGCAESVHHERLVEGRFGTDVYKRQDGSELIIFS